MQLRSPINRFGGKYFLRDFLNQHIPQHILFCEVFAGAANLLFSKEPSRVEVINDIDSHLITFFRVIKDHENRQRLIKTLQYLPYSRKLWQELRLHWKQGNVPGDEIERVSWWYYLNRTTFAGDQLRGGFAVPSATGRNPIISFRNAIRGLDDIAERLQNVCIENLSFRVCIQRYDSQDTLFFCDPPYLDSEHYYGKDSFSQDDHYKLAGLLSKARGKVMVSHYQNSLYDELYTGWYRYEYSSFKGSSKAEPGAEKPKTIECLYTNFEPEVKTRGLFDGLL